MIDALRWNSNVVKRLTQLATVGGIAVSVLQASGV